MNLSTGKRSEVDMRVAQELKNHQDFVYATNTALQEIAFKFKALRDEFSQHQGCVGSEIKTLCIDQERFQTHIEQSQKWSARNVDSFEMRLTALEEIVEEGFNDCYLSMANENDMIDIRKQLWDQMNEVIKAQGANKQVQEHEDFRLYNHIENKINQLRQEIEAKPSEAPALKKELNEGIQVCRIETDGLLKEFRLLNKAVFVLQKHVEDLYMQIKKLKGDK